MKISAADILHYIPHRPPMVWIDWVTDYGPNAGSCLIEIKPEALYMSPEGLRPSSLIEFIAQTYGFCWIAHVTRNIDPSSKGMAVAMLAAFKDVKYAPLAELRKVKAGDTLVCKISGIRAMGPITGFKGQVWLGETLLAEAQMRTFSQ